MAAPLRLAGHAAELRALIASAQPDAVIAWGMRTGLAMSAALAGAPPLPMMLHHHDLLPGPLVARAVRAAAARASLVVALSECMARDLDPERRAGCAPPRSCGRAWTSSASARAMADGADAAQ